jgi:threonine dehydrogenase-like Zn-dependent dehydrogenase
VWAVVLDEDRAPARVQRPDPVPSAQEVLLRPHCCGICGSDLHAGANPLFADGVVLGHEFTAEVLEVGSQAYGWEPGQLVVVNPNGFVCGHCRPCRTGRPNLCLVATTERAAGVCRDGGMAELVALHPAYLRALPDAVDSVRGAWVEPLAVAVRAVRRSRVRIGDRVAVIGGGPVGQLVLRVLRHAGIDDVVLVEPSPFRAALGRAAGAETFDVEAAGSGDVEPADHVFECSGHPSALQLGIDLAVPGGSVKLVGFAPTTVGFTPGSALTKEVDVLTGFIYAEEFEQAIDLLAAGSVDVGPLTTAVLPVTEFAAAFAALRDPERTMKVLLDNRVSSPAPAPSS